MIPNKIEPANGEMEEWLSSGSMLTMTDAEGAVSREFIGSICSLSTGN